MYPGLSYQECAQSQKVQGRLGISLAGAPWKENANAWLLAHPNTEVWCFLEYGWSLWAQRGNLCGLHRGV